MPGFHLTPITPSPPFLEVPGPPIRRKLPEANETLYISLIPVDAFPEQRDPPKFHTFLFFFGEGFNSLRRAY